MTRNVLFIIAAVVAFVVAAVLVLIGGVDHKLVDVLTLAGFASFAAGHV
jgi:hypothetical protein